MLLNLPNVKSIRTKDFSGYTWVHTSLTHSLTGDRDEDALHPELAHLDRVLPALAPRVPAVAVVILVLDVAEAPIRIRNLRNPVFFATAQVFANFVVVLQRTGIVNNIQLRL